MDNKYIRVDKYQQIETLKEKPPHLHGTLPSSAWFCHDASHMSMLATGDVSCYLAECI